jgi:small GTP-binding protein domain
LRTLNLGILAHVDAGKTSLTERLLFEAGAIPELGSVDAGTTRTDSMDIERRRGITVRTNVASFAAGDVQVNLIDTPGHSDFIAEVERSLPSSTRPSWWSARSRECSRRPSCCGGYCGACRASRDLHQQDRPPGSGPCPGACRDRPPPCGGFRRAAASPDGRAGSRVARRGHQAGPADARR